MARVISDQGSSQMKCTCYGHAGFAVEAGGKALLLPKIGETIDA